MAYVALIFFSLVSFHGFWLAGEPFLSNKFHIPNYRKRPFGVALSLVTLICIIVIWLFKGELLGSYFHMEPFFFSCYPIWLCCEFGTRWKQVHKFPIIVRFTDFYVGCVAVSLAFFLFSAPDNNNIQETRTLELLKNKRFQVFVIPPRKPIEVITTVFFTGLSNNSIIFLISKQKPPAMLMMHKKSWTCTDSYHKITKSLLSY